jgi:hypothetical protein
MKKLQGIIIYMRKLFVSCLLLLQVWVGNAQNGTIKGTITDGSTQESLIGTTVFLKGTTTGTVTDLDGHYELPNVQPGSHVLVVSFISYNTQEIPVTLKPDKVLELNVSLLPATLEIEGVKVVAKANREAETILLMERKKSVFIKESIGAQELASQGVSDAAVAATKLTGVTRQSSGHSLNVRGLGDRYNSTTLNGLPIPSNNAETKNVDLTLFDSDVIEYLAVEKTFTAPLWGDFAGANVNIASKKYAGDTYLKLGLKTGWNTSLNGASDFYLQDGPGFWGFDNFKMTSSLSSYDFETTWNPQARNVSPQMGFSINSGKSIDLSGSTLNAFFTLSYDNEYAYSDLIQNRVNGSDDPRKILSGEKFNFDTQTTGMFNLNFEKENSKLYFNSMLLNSSDQELRNLRGFIKDLAEDNALVRRLDYERTTILTNQLLGDHQLNEKMDFNWGLSYNHVQNIIPDRRHISLDGLTDEGVAHFTDDNESDNFRYFHEFVEQEWAANVSISRTFGDPLAEDLPYRGKWGLGYSGKYKARDFESTQFNHDIYRNRSIFNPPPGGYYVKVDVMDIDAFLNDENLERPDGYGFYMKTFFGNTIRSSNYQGRQLANAGFVSLEYQLSPTLLALLGTRIEYIYQSVDFVTALAPEGGSGSFNKLKAFPSLSMKYMPGEKSQFWLAASQTYTLPQFNEMALFLFEGITETTLGNPYLYPSTVYNTELKYELFPGRGELVSVSGFYKYIQDPINRFVMASASNDFTFANTGDWAYVYGTEMEIRKDIFSSIADGNQTKFFVAGNLTLMKTNQELDGEKVREETKDENGNPQISVNFNNDQDGLQGAAPVIANASLGYKKTWNEGNGSFTSSLLYNYVSDRLYLIGTNTFGNQVDQALHTVDVVIRSKINKLGFSLQAKNLLNSSIERVQENLTQTHLVKSYQQGVKFSLGISYTF